MSWNSSYITWWTVILVWINWILENAWSWSSGMPIQSIQPRPLKKNPFHRLRWKIQFTVPINHNIRSLHKPQHSLNAIFKIQKTESFQTMFYSSTMVAFGQITINNFNAYYAWIGFRNWSIVLKKHLEESRIVPSSVFHFNVGVGFTVGVQHPCCIKSSKEEQQKKKYRQIQETATPNWPDSWWTIPAHLLRVIWEVERNRKLMKNWSHHSVQNLVAISYIFIATSSLHHFFVNIVCLSTL